MSAKIETSGDALNQASLLLFHVRAILSVLIERVEDREEISALDPHIGGALHSARHQLEEAKDLIDGPAWNYNKTSNAA